ncbi:TolB-like translocation protein [Poritiphilus flavus]|uniref:Cell envelope biogenesis protein OmpA n=1 Tax=Poritiphilus flavus TaxID=2697053 RepID=A0A6L9E7A6_9FLAO|nr:PD40 domain-containing protein [Poritiphilus flavus]NAS10570.1 cell envelope biogenesis protein OmpA [Poritiphilus flavus]
MNQINSYKTAFGLLLTIFFCCTLSAQQTTTSTSQYSEVREANKRIDDYLKLLKMGYSEREIFEDLGNVNFLTQNYETAAFWYQKLMDISEDDMVSASYHERYQYALKKAGTPGDADVADDKDWVSVIKADYQMKKDRATAHSYASNRSNFRELDFHTPDRSRALDELVKQELSDQNNLEYNEARRAVYQNSYNPPIAMTADGSIAYFSKPVTMKPLTGLFSKKQVVHKIYKAERIDGQWKNVSEVPVAPKYASAVHPSISEDGSRLFFASNMPGTFGKYDIYVSEVKQDGSYGVAKNLGTKVNTKQNDLFPSIVGGSSLFFASDGHQGYGGLDLYAAQVSSRKVSKSMNLGNAINSGSDDFAIVLDPGQGMGYVVSNRGRTDAETVRQLVFSYDMPAKNTLPEKRDYNLFKALNSDSQTDLTSSVFEDQ